MVNKSYRYSRFIRPLGIPCPFKDGNLIFECFVCVFSSSFYLSTSSTPSFHAGSFSWGEMQHDQSHARVQAIFLTLLFCSLSSTYHTQMYHKAETLKTTLSKSRREAVVDQEQRLFPALRRHKAPSSGGHGGSFMRAKEGISNQRVIHKGQRHSLIHTRSSTFVPGITCI